MRAIAPRQGKSLSHARFLGFSKDGARIAFPNEAAFHRAQVLGMSRSLIEKELGTALGSTQPARLLEEIGTEALTQAPPSIAEVEASDRASRETAIEARVRNHPATRAILHTLGGSIEHIHFLEPVLPTEAPPVADDTDTSITD